MRKRKSDRYVVDMRLWDSFDTDFFGVQRRIQAIRDRRAAKEEKERYEKMAEKMHKKRVERLKRREKRNKMLKS
jgi:hypothetical protein